VYGDEINAIIHIKARASNSITATLQRQHHSGKQRRLLACSLARAEEGKYFQEKESGNTPTGGGGAFVRECVCSQQAFS